MMMSLKGPVRFGFSVAKSDIYVLQRADMPNKKIPFRAMADISNGTGPQVNATAQLPLDAKAVTFFGKRKGRA